MGQEPFITTDTELEFLKSLWGLGTEEEEGYRTGPPGYIGWRNSFLGTDSGAPYTFKNTGSGLFSVFPYRSAEYTEDEKSTKKRVGTHRQGNIVRATSSGKHRQGHIVRDTTSGTHRQEHIVRETSSGTHRQGRIVLASSKLLKENVQKLGLLST